MNETKKISRRKYTAEYKAKVALEAMQESQTLPELCSKYQLSPNQINQWKKQLKERSAEVFKAETNGKDDKDTHRAAVQDNRGTDDERGISKTGWSPRRRS